MDPKDDPEARIRELERSLGDFASKSELTSPTTRTTAALDKAFQDGISEDAVTPCPHGGDSPGIWHTEGAPNVSAGSVLCGTYNKGPDLLWTQNKDLLIGGIQGPDLNALYQFRQGL